MEFARCMRLHAVFPLQFWDDSLDNSIYLVNKGPSSDFDGGIPQEESRSKNVNYVACRV